MPSTFPINPSVLPTIPTRKALLILDLQNDFVSPSGALFAPEPDDFVSRALELAKAFRDSNAGDVVWVRSEFERHRPLTPDGEQICVSGLTAIRRVTARGRRPASRAHDDAALEADEEAFLSMPEGSSKPPCVRKGTSGADFPPEVQQAVVPGRDIVFTKTHYSAFASGQQELVQLLRGRFVTEMYICGALTNVSIYATAIDAGRHGYDMTVIDDCCGFRIETRHLAALRQLTELTGSEVVNAEDVMATFRSKKPQEPCSQNVGAKSSSQSQPDDATRELEPALARSPSVQAQPTTGLSPSISKLTLDRSGAPAAAAPSTRPPSAKLPLEPVVAAGSSPKVSTQPDSKDSPSPHARAPLGLQVDDAPAEQPPTGKESDSALGPYAKRLQAAHLTLQSPTDQDCREPPRHPSRRFAAEQPRVRSQLRQRARLSSPEESKPAAKARPVGGKQCPDEESARSPIAAKPIEDKCLAPDKKRISARQTADTMRPQPDADAEKVEAAKMHQHQAPPCVSEPLCEGDTTIITNMLPQNLGETAFERLLDEVSWAGMFHHGGEVPRRIAVQGEVDAHGNMPVYRHPSDESPPLLPFSPTVLAIKAETEKHLGHPLNHVLIQHYRTGNDYISEHSDKTLDIVPGSFIANVSLGAERTMIFRTKRPLKDNTDAEPGPKATEGASSPAEAEAKRQIQRAPLPHNSLCRMGLETNKRWLHSIRQDRRADRDKSPAELSHGGARISLTFRQIGTFLDANNTFIWGQGAKGKTRAEANPVVNGQTPNAVKMLQAFGRENHVSDFDWHAMYGCGFDVLHMGTPKRFCAGTGDAIANTRVTIALAELGVACAKGSVEGDARFEDNDPGRAVVDGHDTVLRYLDAVYGPGRRYDHMTVGDIARRFTRLQRALDLLGKWRDAQDDAARKDEKGRVGVLTGLMKKEMIEWEKLAEEAAMVDTDGNAKGAVYIVGGSQPSPADFALWPVLHDMVRECGEDVLQGVYLKAYYRAFAKRSAVEKALGLTSAGKDTA